MLPTDKWVIYISEFLPALNLMCTANFHFQTKRGQEVDNLTAEGENENCHHTKGCCGKLKFEDQWDNLSF